jgi:hypothetical protein
MLASQSHARQGLPRNRLNFCMAHLTICSSDTPHKGVQFGAVEGPLIVDPASDLRVDVRGETGQVRPGATVEVPGPEEQAPHLSLLPTRSGAIPSLGRALWRPFGALVLAFSRNEAGAHTGEQGAAALAGGR